MSTAIKVCYLRLNTYFHSTLELIWRISFPKNCFVLQYMHLTFLFAQTEICMKPACLFSVPLYLHVHFSPVKTIDYVFPKGPLQDKFKTRKDILHTAIFSDRSSRLHKLYDARLSCVGVVGFLPSMGYPRSPPPAVPDALSQKKIGDNRENWGK